MVFFNSDKKGRKRLLFFLVCLLIVIITGIPKLVFGREPILEYLFNEEGTVALSSGLDKTSLIMQDYNYASVDLHTEGGFGVSGALNDRAFDNDSWRDPTKHNGGVAYHEQVNNEITGLKSFTFQGWFKVDQDGLRTDRRLCMGPFAIVGWFGNAFKFTYKGESFTSAAKYTARNEWVFFAVTVDSTKTSVNVCFYMGTKGKPVELVSTHTHTNPEPTPSAKFMLGALDVAGAYAYYGYLDNIRLYGSKDDGTGALSLTELEQIRADDIFLIPDPQQSEVIANPSSVPLDRPINITVHAKDTDGTNIAGQKVILEKIDGNLDFEPMNAITDSYGKAQFLISSLATGFLELGANMEPNYNLGSISIYFTTAIGPNRRPVLEYLFNEEGTFALNSGLDKMPLIMKDNNNVVSDLHTEGGQGVSGSLNDKAFDNYSWVVSKKGGIAFHEQVNNEITELKSFTFQGWYKVDQDGLLTDARLCKGPFGLYGWFGDALDFQVGSKRTPSAYQYKARNEWVFFAVTFDHTKTSDNVNFYVGTKKEPAKLVSTHSNENAISNAAFYLGGLGAGSLTFYGYLDNIRLYGSKEDGTGVLSLPELEKIRIADNLLLPDPVSSTITASATNCLADGVETVPVTVRIIDEAGNNLSGRNVRLTGTNNFEPMNKTTDADGKAVFQISSKKSHEITFSASVALGYELEPLVLNNKVAVVFTQAVDLTKSKIEGETEPVSADGESKYIVKVSLCDYDNKPIDGRQVQLITDSPDVVIIDLEKETGSEDNSGEASMAIIAKSSLDNISANLTAKVEPDKEGGNPINLSLSVIFTGRLLVEGDAEDYSEIISVKRSLAPGLPETYLAADEVPADGTCNVEITVKLLDKSGPVKQRKFMVFEEEALLEPGDIEQTEISTDDKGIARFTVSTKKELSETLLTEVKVQVLNDKANWVVPIKFIPRNFALWVMSTVPEDTSKEAEVDAPFIITFNNPITLVESVTKITVTPQEVNGGNHQPFTDIYGGISDENWIVEGQTLTWKHPRFAVNVSYTAKLEEVQDTYENTLLTYSWDFQGTDTTPPAVRILNGRFDVEPSPWAVQVEQDTELKVRFTEALDVDNTGYPKGLNVSIQPACRILFSNYDLDNYEIVFSLSDLEVDTTYAVTISGAQDLAQWVMEPATWNFRTGGELQSPPKVIYVDIETNENNDVKIDTTIQILFNKPLMLEPKPEIKITNNDTGAVIAGSTYLIPGFDDDIGLIFIPDASLEFDTYYLIELVNVRDQSGRILRDWTKTILTELLVSEVQEVTEAMEQYRFSLPQSTGEGLEINILVPAGTFETGTKMQVLNVHESEKQNLAAKSFNKQIVATPGIYELIAFNQEGLKENNRGQITVTIPYQENGSGYVYDFSGNLIPEPGLQAFCWDERMQDWIALRSSINTNEDTVTCEMDYLGIIGLFGEIGSPTVYLSDVKLTNNPIAPGTDGLRNETIFKFRLAYESKVTLNIYDSSGRLVTTLMQNEVYPAGYNSYRWDGFVEGRKLRSGIYLYRLFTTSLDGGHPNNYWVSGTIGIIN